MENLVVGPLHEGGVDGHDGDDPLRRHPRGEGHPVLLRDPHVEEALGEHLRVGVEPRPAAHGRRDGHDLRVRPGELDHRPAEDLRVAGDAARVGGQVARAGVEGADAVELRGLQLGEGVALPLFRQHVDQHGPVVFLDVAQHGDEMVEAVPLQGSHVLEAQLLEEGPGGQEALEGLLGLAREPDHLLAHVGDAPEKLLHVVAQPGDPAARHDLVEVGRQGAHVGRDRHLVVVEDDDEILLAVARPVEALEGHARRHGSVADHGDDLVALAVEAARLGDPRRRRDRGAAVPHAEDVVGALLAPREAADPAASAQRVEPLAPSRDDLVGVGLMAHVPDDLVPGGVEDVVQGEGELHGAQRRGEVAAVAGTGLDDDPADLLREDFELVRAEPLDVGR